MEDKVTVTKIEYKHLLETCYKYGLLMDVIYNTKELAWDRDFIEINNKNVGSLLNIIDKDRYEKKVKELKEKENNE